MFVRVFVRDGSVVMLVFFSGYDRCLKELWVVVGSGVWVVFG